MASILYLPVKLLFENDKLYHDVTFFCMIAYRDLLIYVLFTINL
jgi:hypothetical protein